MRHVFPSVLAPNERAFVYDSFGFTSTLTCRSFGYYATFGDGMTAHSPDIALQVNMLVDYILSLGKILLETPKMARDVVSDITPRYGRDTLLFALSVKYKDDSKAFRRYYSTELRKISTSESKANDRRWERVEPFHEGTGESAMRILCQDFYDNWARYVLADAIRSAALSSGYVGVVESPANIINWKPFSEDHQLGNLLMRALHHTRDVAKALCDLDCAKFNLQSTIDTAKRHATQQEAA